MVNNPAIYHPYKIVLPDGRRIFMLYNLFTGPYFYHDKHHQRPIMGWINDAMILHALFWFLHRGCKA